MSKKTAFEQLPNAMLDTDGYPLEQSLEFIRKYKPDETLPILDFVENILRDIWWQPKWGFLLHRKYKGKRKLQLHTGGWSGNEEVIAAIKSNISLTHFHMKYVAWRTGGHYYFEIMCN